MNKLQSKGVSGEEMSGLSPLLFKPSTAAG